LLVWHYIRNYLRDAVSAVLVTATCLAGWRCPSHAGIVSKRLNLSGYYGTLIGSHGCRIEWYNFWWPWV